MGYRSIEELADSFLADEVISDEDQKLAEKIKDAYSEAFAKGAEEQDDIFEQLLFDEELMESLDGALDLVNIIELFDDSEKEPETVENTYLNLFDTYVELAKVRNVMDGFGKDRLNTCLEVIKAYEERYGNLYTKITKNNIECFKHLIPEEHIDSIEVGRENAIGFLKKDGDITTAAGALVYSVYADEDIPEDSAVRLEHIYVLREYRGYGVGNLLLARMVKLALDAGINIVTVEYTPIKAETDEEKKDADVLEQFLDSWNFDFRPAVSRDFKLGLSELKGNPFVDSPYKDVVSLDSLGSKADKLISDFFRSEDKDNEDIKVLPTSYFDPNVSCAIVDDKGIAALLLVRDYLSGSYRLEYIGKRADINEKVMLELVKYAFNTCKTLGLLSRYLYGTFTGTEGMELLKKIAPQAEVMLTFAGIIKADFDQEIPSEGWKELREMAYLPDHQAVFDEEPVPLTEEEFTKGMTEFYEMLKEKVSKRREANV